jgi:hypothetical protein
MSTLTDEILRRRTSRNIIRWTREERLTIRQIYQRFAAARGQRTLIGLPSEIADNMEEWFRSYGVDGFLFHPSARRFRRARDPRTTVAWSVSGRVQRRDVAREYGARTAQEPLRLKLI